MTDQVASDVQLIQSPPDFHVGWQQWLAENLMRSVSTDKIQAVLLRRGFPADFVSTQIDELQHSPAIAAGRGIHRTARKLSSLLEALSRLYAESGYARAIPVHEHLPVPAPVFYQHYYYANRPVVIRSLMQHWPAARLWSPRYFADTFGDCTVEITSGRAGDPRYEDNFRQHRSTVTMAQYVDMVETCGETNDFYLVAKNFLLDRPEFAPLREHFDCPEGYLNAASLSDHVKLWFGPGGTVTPLHHDACNIFFGQIYGRKRVKLISPFDIVNVYNDRECYSAVDLDEIERDRFPLMRRVSVAEVVLNPGDFVLLPIGWWHWVKSIDTSISLSFTNFCTDNPPLGVSI